MSACPFERGKDQPGRVCYACAVPLPPRAQRWCSKACSDGYWQNHGWSYAREAALRRDGHRCVRCGLGYPPQPAEVSDEDADVRARSYWLMRGPDREAAEALYRKYKKAVRDWSAACYAVNLEVNHIDPRHGRGYGNGCWNHLENLETLCRACHQAETKRQREDRKGSDVPVRRFWVTQWRPIDAWEINESRRCQTRYRHAVRRKQELFLTLADAVADARKMESTRVGPYYDRYPGETRFAPILLRVDEIEQRGTWIYSLVQRANAEMPFDRPEAFVLLETP